MIDSADRSSGTWGNFTINRTNSILNGFFHRLGATEVVLEWNEPNIQGGLNSVNSRITVTVGATTSSVIIPDGFYTVETAFESLIAVLTAANIPTATWTFTPFEGVYFLSAGVGIDFSVADTPLARRMDIYNPGADNTPARQVTKPDLRPYRYIDIVSPNLTYNQRLKDASTASLVRDVLVRWYFAWDDQPVLDADGFPILMGYTPFTLRRLFSPPKQIKWENNMPVGQIAFEVYGNNGVLIKSDDDVQFLMTIQASED
jgi:hypothetical protein